MFKISGQIIKFIMRAMENKRLELTVEQTLPEVKIQWGIFHGDSFLSQLFVIPIMPLSYIIKKMYRKLNATDLIWRVLAFFDGISSWTP